MARHVFNKLATPSRKRQGEPWFGMISHLAIALAMLAAQRWIASSDTDAAWHKYINVAMIATLTMHGLGYFGLATFMLISELRFAVLLRRYRRCCGEIVGGT